MHGKFNLCPVFLDNKPVEAEIGNTLFQIADKLSVRVPTSCSRNGECHECIIEVNDGMDSLSGKSKSEEFLRGNFRLACQAKILNQSKQWILLHKGLRIK